MILPEAQSDKIHSQNQIVLWSKPEAQKDFYPWFPSPDTLSIFVSLRQTIAVTFKRILQRREEGRAEAVTECMRDWRRGTRCRRQGCENEN